MLTVGGVFISIVLRPPLCAGRFVWAAPEWRRSKAILSSRAISGPLTTSERVRFGIFSSFRLLVPASCFEHFGATGPRPELTEDFHALYVWHTCFPCAHHSGRTQQICCSWSLEWSNNLLESVRESRQSKQKKVAANLLKQPDKCEPSIRSFLVWLLSSMGWSRDPFAPRVFCFGFNRSQSTIIITLQSRRNCTF